VGETEQAAPIEPHRLRETVTLASLQRHAMGPPAPMQVVAVEPRASRARLPRVPVAQERTPRKRKKKRT